MGMSSPTYVSERAAVVREQFIVRRGLLIRGLAVVLALVAWEGYSSTQPSYFFPGLAAIFDAFLTQLREYGLLAAFSRTMGTVVVGYTLGVVVGAFIGLSMGLDKRVEVTLDPYVSALYVAPVSAMIPIIIMVGGPTLESRVFVVFLFVVFELIVTTLNGTKTTPEGMVSAVRSFGGGQLTVVRKIVLPHTLPYMFAGMRLGVGRAIKGVILAELLIEFSNLGAIVREWEELFQLAGVLSIAILLMLTGIVLTRGVKVVRDRVITWETEGPT